MALVRSRIRRTALHLHLSHGTCSGPLLNGAGPTASHAVPVRGGGPGPWSDLDREVSPGEVTAAAADRYATTTDEESVLLRSNRLPCWTRPALSRVSRVDLGHMWRPGPGRVCPVRAYGSGNNNNRTQSGGPLYKTRTGYYEVLEVSPSATHAQIKTAYYKQSFRHHPDRNRDPDGEEGGATRRFSDVTEAYHVLGNAALKKRYDRGILTSSDLLLAGSSSGRHGPPTKETASETTQTSGSRTSSVMGGVRGSRTVFDFDDFIKSHYGAQLQRQRDAQARKEEMMTRRRAAEKRDWKLDGVPEVAVGALLVVAVAILFNLKKGDRGEGRG